MNGIQEHLETEHFGHPLVYMSTTGSTNDVAKEMAARGAPEGTVVVADEQTAGRGRLDRRWLAPAGTSLLCSILFRPPLPLSRANRLTMLCSLAAADAVEEVSGLLVDLKWPNDLIISTKDGWRKLAGVLTETGVTGMELDFVVVGLGINVNVPREVLPDLAPGATGILAETGRAVDRAALLAALLAGVEARYAGIEDGVRLHAAWTARLATLGRQVIVTTGQEVLRGVAEEVDLDGALLLRTPDGDLRRLVAGDVTLR